MTGVSIIIRTLNEAEFLGPVLAKIKEQAGEYDTELILIDSNSTDSTPELAVKYGCRVLQLPREEFSWGRALNLGMEAAKCEYCILLSGHCLPVNDDWIDRIVRPLADTTVAATCGRQVPWPGIDPFEEPEIERWFPPLKGNTPFLQFTSAASALKKSLWRQFPFDETINSMEDADVSVRMRAAGYKILYVPAAAVYHSHRISVKGIYRRWYWRERVGMYLRRNEDPRIRKASTGIRPYLAPVSTANVTLRRYFWRGTKNCLTRGYVAELWKAGFYEIVREWGVYAGVRDGLLDVKNDDPPRQFIYYSEGVPRFIRLLSFIEK